MRKSKKSGIYKRIGKVALFFFAILFLYFYIGLTAKPEKMEWGVTFAPQAAEGLGLSWKEVYLAILEDLKVDNLRLSAYWNVIEPAKDRYDFSELDYQIEEAAKRNVKIVLAVGRRLPRWPECHEPEWVQDEKINIKNQKLLDYIKAVILRYKDVSQILMWQVENEFFLRNFGECPKADAELLDEELALVRSLDSRPVLLTDSGELGGWWGSLRRADIFGTTMYRIVYNPRIGYAKYPLNHIYYKRRFLLYKPFVKAREIVNVELQGEPWATTTLRNDPTEVLYKSLSPEQFQNNLAYAEASGISPAFIWGVEWWYYMNKVRGISEFWQIAKQLWTK